ncbi:MAG: YncE family protein [Cyanobacteria bacterium REEB67]|nr:YncE family protein [Cyanobacteria bacterium REEB67]
MQTKSILAISLALLAGMPSGSAADTHPEKTWLKEAAAITIPGGAGSFDWMAVDNGRRRMLAAHKGTGRLTLLDLDKDILLSELAVGECQGIAIAEEFYYIGDAKEHKVVIVNAGSLKIEGEIAVAGEIDAMAYCSENRRVYADEDDGNNVWVLDPKAKACTATVKVPAAPEYLVYGHSTHRIYQNIKSSNTVEVIDVKTNKIVFSWSTLPAEKPHGLALDAKHKRLYSAGGNGILVAMDLESGKVVAHVAIPERVDQIAFDPQYERLYCACGGKTASTLAVVSTTAGKLKVVAALPCHKGTHTLTVDPKTHAVWTCFADESNSYVQRFDAAP